MIKLSVIIVNYNVEYFLEHCLHSVYKALKNVPSEVFVVDNNSVDGSLTMIRKKFPQVHLIENFSNVGFAKANNQAIRISKGEYILLLNPDTVVEEDTFEKVVKFMDEHPDAGGLGVKMLDGKGNFLPESKRGLPTPSVAFYKIFGLSFLFPKSKVFGKYHLGHLDNNKTSEVDVLAGAFLLLRKTTIDKTGLLDEDFFMYGEDIDLSNRIKKAGYKNYYFPETRIIHYKGESTRKSSINYVFVFYKAMAIFARKHFSQNNAKLFSLLIHFAIYLRAGIAIVKRFIIKAALPLFDAAVLLGGLIIIKNYYEQNVKFTEGGSYSTLLVWSAFSGYMAIWLLSVFLSGGYDKPIRLLKIARGILVGTGIILIIYSLMPEIYRFSRALILLGSVWALLSLFFSRMFFHLLKIKGFVLNRKESKRIIISGSRDECERVRSLLGQTMLKADFIGYVNPQNDSLQEQNFIGKFSQLNEIISIHKIDEVIFCAKDLSSQTIINSMLQLGSSGVDYKIAPPESLSVIGSSSINTSGDLYVIDVNSVTKPVNKRNKRLVDLSISLLLLISLPIAIFIVAKPIGLIRNIFSVMLGIKSWVGYEPSSEFLSIRRGVLKPSDILNEKDKSEETAKHLNLLYVKDYRIWNDIQITLKGFRKLGN